MHLSVIDINTLLSKYYINKGLVLKPYGSRVMREEIARLANDESGASVADHTMITIALPILCIAGLAAAGISMATGASLLSAPSTLMEMLGAGLFSR